MAAVSAGTVTIQVGEVILLIETFGGSIPVVVLALISNVAAEFPAAPVVFIATFWENNVPDLINNNSANGNFM